jgi:hypothetical protein
VCHSRAARRIAAICSVVSIGDEVADLPVDSNTGRAAAVSAQVADGLHTL